MAKNKISDYNSNPVYNTDIAGIDIDEGCAPSGINNAIRTVMGQLKDFQTGTQGDNFIVGGALTITGNTTLSNTLTVSSSTGTSGQVLVSNGSSSAPSWGNAFVTGMIMMWSGSIATIPTGWLLCNGSSGTPDLRNTFIVGAYSDNVGVANTTITGSSTQTGGSKDAIVVSHTHTATSTDSGHTHTYINGSTSAGYRVDGASGPAGYFGDLGTTNSGNANISTTIASSGSSGTNANLVPYYALAFIMKA
jgi:microcystin-dependent protein